MIDVIEKAKRRIWGQIISCLRHNWIYPFLYKSYWHSIIFSKKRRDSGLEYYFTARPNPGAGIGHQMANWIAGYWWAKQFGLKFAHSQFSNPEWETFLGFGAEEPTVHGLLNNGYKRVLLPLFAESRGLELQQIRNIIASYTGRKVVFVCEADQFYRDQHGVIADIQRKFYASISRKDDKLTYSKANYNIAIHVRRGDISIGQENKNPNLLMRWQQNSYFTNVLSNVLRTVNTARPIAIYLFSQGSEGDFEDFRQFSKLHFCLGMSAHDSFLHMVFADLLITSKSSFSYKPALLNRGIKVCPKNFWHGYPKTEDWILADDNGDFCSQKI